ncbi:putative transcription initiation factor tfiid complex 60 kda subunit [Phaeomoniella chlamydospora]|uniref:TBP-associated factor 6 n=1 Tax=Phaeomoniella chlamydospora TaxID=158046 RepID=A0A0G2FVM3_PHACM|nr:putative transcription initiation factor tfiid complex 60 kda subunit [Phaeomoniella chlamydospora]
MTSVWNPDNVKDVADSVGVTNLKPDVANALSRDVEYRLSMALEEAIKCMKHAKRTVLWSQDIAEALRLLNVEPLYGYESTRPLRFGEASLGPGQPLFYVEDEEMDFEKLINAPLPKVPREMSFTAHWLAVEGVQPSIPQNPTSADSKNLELLAKGPGANPNLAAMNGLENTTTKPQVKHILSKELQQYFSTVCQSVLDENSEEYRVAGLASLRQDPGLHQLVPYFVQFVAEKVTHNLKDLFVLTQMMYFVEALVRNPSLFLDSYVSSIIPPVLTCLIGRNLGSGIGALDHFDLRDLAASLIELLCKKYSKSSPNLKQRLARSCLKNFLDPNKPYGTHYGAILGLEAVGGAEVVRALVIPNLKEYESLIREEIQANGPRKAEGEKVLGAILRVLASLVDDNQPLMNGHSEEAAEEMRMQLIDKIGELVGSRVAESGRTQLARAILA